MGVEQLLDDLLKREGGYVNHPADRGGPTNFGITQEVARMNGYHGDMRSFPRNEALEIYRRLYWLRPNYNLIAEIYPKVAEELFDTGVNMGPKRASMFLQRLLNALNREGRDWPDLLVDGKVGTQTLNALRAFGQVRGKGDAEKVLLRGLDALQGAFYIELAERDTKQEAFLMGWVSHRLGNVK